MTTGGLRPGPHGDDARRLAADLGLDPSTILDLSASLNPFAPDVAAIAGRHLGELRRYSDQSDLDGATRGLAGAFGVDPDRVLITNGGSEAIALVAGELGRGWVDEPDFSLYRRHLRTVERGAPRFRSDPHNPTGCLAQPREGAAVWDEAFYPLATGRWTRGDVAQGDSIVVGSLTKLFACPGLRIGYVLAPRSDPGVIERLARRQPRWSVNGLALAVMPDLMEAADLGGWKAKVATARQDLVTVLRFHGVRAAPSDANYVLVHEAPELRHRLASCGVMVRDCSSFGLPDAVRIAVPDERGLDRFEAALVSSSVWLGSASLSSPSGRALVVR
jgi:histidinol-phosphate/aromatic aminotransferase/cobyric acid decarboxylase-like protein